MKYKDLTDTQKAKICNGCGGKGGWIKIPNFIFFASCNHHDYNYWVGGTEKDRLIADLQFYKWMIVDATRVKNKLLVPYYLAWATSYFLGVRVGGWKYFSYGDKKTIEDLKKL